MARSRRRSSADATPARALVLDAEGLNRAAAGDHRIVAWIARARELQLPVVINAVTLTETLRGSPRDAPIHLLTRNAHIDLVDAAFAAAAGALLGRTRRSDTVDALVATTAIRLAKPVIVVTSDPTDLTALTAEAPHVTVIAV
jgi:hypothetical protein